MKDLIKNIKRNYYAKKMYKAIRFINGKKSMATINGNEYICYIDKKYLGKKFEESKYESWLSRIMKNKYGMRFLKCKISCLKNYYIVTYYKL